MLIPPLKLIPRFCTPMWCVPIPSVTPVCLRRPTEPWSRRGIAERTASVHAPFSKSTACSACPCPSASPVCLVFTLTTILSVPLCANPLGAFGRVVWHPQRPLLCTVAERSSFCVRYACTATRAVRSALNLLSGESREGDDSPNSPCPAFPRTPYHPIPSSPTSSPLPRFWLFCASHAPTTPHSPITLSTRIVFGMFDQILCKYLQ